MLAWRAKDRILIARQQAVLSGCRCGSSLSALSGYNCRMYFEIIGEIKQVEIIAAGAGVRERNGCGKPMARTLAEAERSASIKLSSGTQLIAELHWYEAHGIARKSQNQAAPRTRE